MTRTWSGVLGIPTILGLVLLLGGSGARAATVFNSAWTNGAGGNNDWSDPDNWTPVLTIPPVNELVATVQFTVDVQSPACSGSVDFDLTSPSPVEVLDLTLGAGCTLDLETSTSLSVCSAASATCMNAAQADLAGLLNGLGGDFSAVDGVFTGTAPRVLACCGSALSIGSGSPPQTLDTSGIGNATILSATDPGTVVDLPSIETWDAGFNGGFGTQVHTAQSLAGGALALTGLTTLMPPLNGEDRIDFVCNGGTLDLSSLNTILGSGGWTRFPITDCSVSFPELEIAEDVGWYAYADGTIEILSDLGFGPVAYSTTGLTGTMIQADGANALVDAPSLTSWDASFNGGFGTQTQSVSATNGGTVILGLESLVLPQNGEDRVDFVVDAGVMQLDHLNSVPASGGRVLFQVTSGTLSLPELETAGDALWYVNADGSIHAVNDPGFGPVAWTTTGFTGTPVQVVGPNALLEAPSIERWNANYNGGFGTQLQTVVASQAGVIDFSGMTTIDLPQNGEDRVDFNCDTGAATDLSGLTDLCGSGRIRFDLDDCQTQVGRLTSPRPTDIALANGADFQVAGDLAPRGAGSTTGDASSITVGGHLALVSPGSSTLSLTGGSTLDLRGDLAYDTTAVADVALGDTVVSMRGGTRQQLLEVGGLDVGTLCGLLPDDNFGMGQLRVGDVGQPTTVRLMDGADNGHRNGIGGSAEALYLFGPGPGARCSRAGGGDGLVIDPASVLVLDGLNLYVWDDGGGAFVHVNSLFPGSPDPNEISLFGGTIRLASTGSDQDADHVEDDDDNCLIDPNGPYDASRQLDTDMDGYGNACDIDFNEDGVTGIPDFIAFLGAYDTTACDTTPGFDADADLNGDRTVATPDFVGLLALFGRGAPGPSGLGCAGTVPCP